MIDLLYLGEFGESSVLTFSFLGTRIVSKLSLFISDLSVVHKLQNTALN